MDGVRYGLQQASWENSSVRLTLLYYHPKNTVDVVFFSQIFHVGGFPTSMTWFLTSYNDLSCPTLIHISSTLAPNRPHMENALGSGFRRNKKAMAVGLSSVSVLAADSPLFFWMHRHWRAMIQISAPTSGSLLFLSCYPTIRFVLVEVHAEICIWLCEY